MRSNEKMLAQMEQSVSRFAYVDQSTYVQLAAFCVMQEVAEELFVKSPTVHLAVA